MSTTIASPAPATFSFAALRDERVVFADSIILPPEMTLHNNDLQDLADDLNQLLDDEKIEWIRAIVVEDMIWFNVTSTEVGNFDDIALSTDIHVVVTESTTLGDGTSLSVTLQDDVVPGALGFVPVMRVPVRDGRAVLEAKNPTTPAGDHELSAKSGQVTTDTVTAVDVFLDISLWAAGSSLYTTITLDAADVADNSDLDDLLADVGAAIDASPLAGAVNLRLNGQRIELISQALGSQVSLST